jgi:hypothetical protein
VVQRGQQLPLDHALSHVPRVRLLLEDLAGCAVPDLGPAVLMDQLTVLVYDACEANGPGEASGPREVSGPGEASTRHTQIAQRLADLRRSLSDSR